MNNKKGVSTAETNTAKTPQQNPQKTTFIKLKKKQQPEQKKRTEKAQQYGMVPFKTKHDERTTPVLKKGAK